MKHTSLSDNENKKLKKLYNELNTLDKRIKKFENEGFSDNIIQEEILKYNKVSEQIGLIFRSLDDDLNIEEIHNFFNDQDNNAPKYKFIPLKDMNKTQFKAALKKISFEVLRNYTEPGKNAHNIFGFCKKDKYDLLSQKEKLNYLLKEIAKTNRFVELFQNFNKDIMHYESFIKKYFTSYFEDWINDAEKNIQEIFIDDYMIPMEESLKNGYKYPNFPMGTFFDGSELSSFCYNLQPEFIFEKEEIKTVQEKFPEGLYKLYEDLLNNLKEILKRINKEKLHCSLTFI